MEAYLRRLKSQNEADLQEATSLGAAELGRRAEEEQKRLQALKDDAMIKLEKLMVKQQEKEERQRLWLELKERRYAEKLRRMKEEAHRKKMEEIQYKTRKYYQLDHLWRKKETGVTYFGDHRDTRDAWYPHGRGQLIKEGDVVYDGTFCRGMIHGSGTYTFENGDKFIGPFRRDKMHGCGRIVCLRDGAEKECIYQNHQRICFTDELLPGTRIRLHRYKCKAMEVGTVIGRLPKPGHFRVRVDDGNVVNVDLGDTPFKIAHDLPPLHLLDITMGETFAQKTYDYEEDLSRPEPLRSDHLENIFRHNDEWMIQLQQAKKKAAEKAAREERKRIEEQRKQEEARKQAEERDKETVQEALKMQREKNAAEKAAKEEEDKKLQDDIEAAKLNVKIKFGKA